MTRPFFVVIPAIILVGIVLFGVDVSAISIADTSISTNDVTSSEANNAPATATITITRTGVLDDAVQYSYEEEIPASITVSNADNHTSYNITLNTGWNLVSLPLIPDNTSIANVTAGISADVAIIWGYSGNTTAWHWYVPGNPSSSLTTMEDGFGYWFSMYGPAILEVSGREMPDPPIITPAYDLFKDWNLIGFTSTTSMSPGSYLASVAGNYSLVWGWDGEGQTWLWYVPGNPSSTLTTMEPGDGYWLHGTGEGTIVPPKTKPSKILFISDSPGNKSELYVMDADGSNQMNLTNDPATDDHPCWSPDGEEIVFVSWRDGNREIYIMDSDGSNLKNLTNNPAHDRLPSWSPDGKKIIFQSNRDGEYCGYSMDADGYNQTKLPYYPTNCDHCVLSPDGRKIAFPRRQGSTQDLWVMDLETGEETALTHLSLETTVWYPLWSPDGIEIAFTVHADGHYEVYLVNVDGSGLRRVTSYSGNVNWSGVPPGYYALEWFPDGEKLLVWLWDTEVRWDLVSIDKDGENEVNLTRDLPDGAISPFGSCSPDGEKIAFSIQIPQLPDSDGRAEVWVVDADGSNLTRLTYNETRDSAPTWQPR